MGIQTKIKELRELVIDYYLGNQHISREDKLDDDTYVYKTNTGNLIVQIVKYVEGLFILVSHNGNILLRELFLEKDLDVEKILIVFKACFKPIKEEFNDGTDRLETESIVYS